jgi:hypothetical protein
MTKRDVAHLIFQMLSAERNRSESASDFSRQVAEIKSNSDVNQGVLTRQGVPPKASVSALCVPRLSRWQRQGAKEES